MYWQEWSDRLKRELNLDTEPVAVTFAGPPTSGNGSPKDKLSVCQALRKASDGEAVVITQQTCGCPGGMVSLGLGEVPPQGKEKLVDFLVNMEKVYCSRVAIHRGQESVPPPMGLASRVLFSPLAKAEEPPDVVVFIGKPGSLHRLLNFAAYWQGGPMRAELAGPTCRTGVAYPAVTGEVGLSLIDAGARRLGRFREDHALVAVPMHRMIGIISALDHGVGQKAEKSEAVAAEIHQLGVVAPGAKH